MCPIHDTGLFICCPVISSKNIIVQSQCDSDFTYYLYGYVYIFRCFCSSDFSYGFFGSYLVLIILHHIPSSVLHSHTLLYPTFSVPLFSSPLCITMLHLPFFKISPSSWVLTNFLTSVCIPNETHISQ